MGCEGGGQQWVGGDGGQKLHHSLIPTFITHFIHPRPLITFLLCELRSAYHHLNSLALLASGVSLRL